MRRARLILAALAVLAPLAADAQTIVTSPGPDRVAVTVYRDPDREPGQQPNLGWLNGYALISETRQISIPAGESTIRFEGVAGGIVPQTAIVAGFPEDIIERNRDAYLLSPATILDRSLGRRVHLRRTSRATGAVREQEAVILSGAGGAVVLQTADGFESLRCTGQPETILYDGVPAELASRPTLSVRARSTQPVTATVTLSYLATGFDWQANYIAQLSPDGRRVDLFAWLTLASTDETSFVAADTQAVAGVVNYERARPQPREGGPLNLQCWPAGRTSDIPLYDGAPPPPPMAAGYGDDESIVVTAHRTRTEDLVNPLPAMVASEENLGDLKLFRIPEPVTVAANSQKQVALLVRPNVRVDLVYRQQVDPIEPGEPEPVPLWLVTRNRSAEGLGVALPGGTVALFAEGLGRPILLGEGQIADRSVGDDVEIVFAPATGVRTQVTLVRETPRWREYRLIVSSDRPAPVAFEAEFRSAGTGFMPSRRLPRRDGYAYWPVRVPANGTASLTWRVRLSDDSE
jgi:hypothetical protein